MQWMSLNYGLDLERSSRSCDPELLNLIPDTTVEKSVCRVKPSTAAGRWEGNLWDKKVTSNGEPSNLPIWTFSKPLLDPRTAHGRWESTELLWQQQVEAGMTYTAVSQAAHLRWHRLQFHYKQVNGLPKLNSSLSDEENKLHNFCNTSSTIASVKSNF